MSSRVSEIHPGDRNTGVAEGFSWAGPRWQGDKEARKVERTYMDVLFASGRWIDKTVASNHPMYTCLRRATKPSAYTLKSHFAQLEVYSSGNLETGRPIRATFFVSVIPSYSVEWRIEAMSHSDGPRPCGALTIYLCYELKS